MKFDARTAKFEYFAEIQRNADDLTRFCSDLIKIPSENPPGDTSKVAGFLQDYLRSRGFSVSAYEPRSGLFNLVSSIGSDQKPNLVLNAHMDVYAADVSKWTVPPFSGRVAEGKVFGRGACDMKGGLAALVRTFELLSRIEKSLRGRCTLTLVSDEEGMGNNGTEWLLNNRSEVRGDACLSAEPMGTQAIGIGEKGFVWLKLKSFGRSAQGAYTALGDNAITRMVRALMSLDALNDVGFPTPKDLKGVIRGQKAYWRTQYAGAAASGMNRLLDHVSVNVSRISGGQFIGLVADYCETELNTRLPIGAPHDYIERKVAQIMRKPEFKDKLAVELLNKSKPNYTSPKEWLVRLAVRNVEILTRRKALPTISVGATDQWRFRVRGIPSLKYGPMAHSMGGVDEYATVEDILRTTKVHAAIAVDFLTTENSSKVETRQSGSSI